MAIVMGSFIRFNTSQYAYNLYEDLNQKYSPFQVNTWGTFIILTVIYYFVAGLFAFVDLSGRPRFLFKYKIQPFQRVNASEYWETTKVVVRNQIVVVLPLVFIKTYLTPNEIDPKYLPGPWKTFGHVFFNVVSWNSDIFSSLSSNPKLISVFDFKDVHRSGLLLYVSVYYLIFCD